MPTPQERLRRLWREIRDLGAAAEILGWDQETYMPKRGQAGRGRVLATLAGLRHARLSSPELGEAIQACEESAPPGSVEEAEAREARRHYDRTVKVPAELARALAEATSSGLAAWQEARAKADFGLFEKELAGILALKREKAAALAGDGKPYDALLDGYEPGATEAELAPLFDRLRASLSPLVKAVADSGRVVDESPVQGAFAPEKQLEFGRMVAAQMGFDFEAGRIDASTHPFCSGFQPDDVRLTWRCQEDDLRPALFGIMHEAGHGLYEQGLPRDWQGTPLGGAVSLGVHESQSRLWENLVGRGRPFWAWALPHYHAAFPEKAGIGTEQVWSALHAVRPSFIRVEADETTYNLHISARFQIERALFSGGLEVADLSAAWDDAYDDLLGIRPASQAEGVLQDIHWAMGAFGYFPTYTLGNLINSQIFEAARSELGDLDDSIERGEFAPLLGWLRENIHRHGSRYRPAELIERATGKPLAPDDFLDYIRRTTEEIYDLQATA